MEISKKLTIILSALVLMFVSSTVYAQEGASDTDEWQFKFTPRFAASGMKGDTTVSGITADVDLSFSDILDNFDVLAFNGGLEAWKGDWGFILNGDYMALDGDFNFKLQAPGSTLDVDVTIVAKNLHLAVGRRLFTIPLGAARDTSSGKSTPSLSLVLFGGGRYSYLKQEIDLSLAGPEIGEQSETLGGSEDWVEPFVGGRIGLAFTERLTLVVNGDIGGFGIGTASDLTWHFFAGIDYRFLQWLSGTAGYSIYDIKYERGSDRDRFGIDMQMAGPAIALSFYF